MTTSRTMSVMAAHKYILVESIFHLGGMLLSQNAAIGHSWSSVAMKNVIVHKTTATIVA